MRSRGVGVPFPERMATRRRCPLTVMIRVSACGLVVSDSMDHPFSLNSTRRELNMSRLEHVGAGCRCSRLILLVAQFSWSGPGYPCFFVPEISPVQRRTSAACASIILFALSCQSCTRFLPACAPAPGSGLKLISLTMLNQPCQSSRSASAHCCTCSRSLRASSRNSSGVPLALARVSVNCRVNWARASTVSFTEDCQASTVFVQSSSVGVPPSLRRVSSQSVSSFCCVSDQVFNMLSFVFLSLIDPLSFHWSYVRNTELVVFARASIAHER